MIWKVLKSNIKIPQLSAAFIGVLCGITLLMGAVLFYVDVKDIFTDREGFWKDEYVVINKSIHLSDSYHQIRGERGNKNVFSTEEIEEIKSKDYVIDVAPFIASTFSVSVHTDRQSAMPGFYSDLFFEAIPDEYIDVAYDDWHWEEGMTFIPIILPRTYLNLYNFGFAQSQNLPQLSEDGIGVLNLNVTVRGNNNRENFTSRIVGFSDRINTFLVPKPFLTWANKNFGSEESPNPGRLIVITNDPSNEEMLKFFQDNQYRVDSNILSNAKALMFLRIISAIVLTIGIIIIALAFWLMIVSLLLLLERNHDNIAKLGMLGYLNREISKPYIILIITLLLSTFVVAIIPLSVFRNSYHNIIVSFGYEVSPDSVFLILLPTLLFVFALSAYLIFYVKKQVKSIMLS